jgi:hypothetical protein
MKKTVGSLALQKSRKCQWEFQDPKMEVPIPYIRPIFQALVSGNIPRKYGQKYGTFTYLHQLDPEDLPLKMWLHSLDWFKGKFTGNHGFYHQI